jgi:cytochrome bd-type quinol oxidase subunit 2
MTRSDFLRRSIKLIAKLAMIIGLCAAFIGVVGGYSMGGAVLQGDLYGDALRLAFIVLPLVAACLFAFAVARENGRPSAATLIYGVVIGLVAVQLALSALP